MRLFKDIIEDIKKYKKFFIPIIIVIVLSLIYAVVNYSSLGIYSRQQKIDMLNSLIKEEKYNEAWSFAQKEFNSDEKLRIEEIIIGEKEHKELDIFENKMPLKITGVNLDDDTVKIRVKNSSNKEINHIKYDLYYYDTKYGSNEVIGIDTGVSDQSILSGAEVEINTNLENPGDAKFCEVRIREYN
ncbi:hypothetical protein ACY0I0_15230 [Clostridium perfringens]|uniref:hypothetical protein n=1 Tax=Clostridium perfringens TaxID=1502 RepID=UPI00285CE0B9|nr:hypothetical protein [Clostridium perfringens]ELC8345825.1 hypothetical protein [Clostridium perfringens]